MKTAKKFLLPALFACLYLFATAAGLKNVQNLRMIYPGWSLRYQEDIPAEQVFSIRRALVNNENNKAIWPTFWTEKTENLQSFRDIGSKKVIYYDGNPSLVLPAQFLWGGYPGEFDTNRAAVSTQIAWKLWGSNNVSGKSFQIGTREYTVCGIFESEEETVLAGIEKNDDMGWRNVEILAPQEVSREKVSSIIEQAGLPSDAQWIDGSGLVMLARLFIYLPLAISILILCVMLIQMLPRRSWQKFMAIFLFGLAFAFSLPWILAQFPAWLLPTQWSDFSFWTDLSDQLHEYTMEWFRMIPQDKDLPAKGALIWQAILFCVALLSTFGLWKSLPAKKEVYNA